MPKNPKAKHKPCTFVFRSGGNVYRFEFSGRMEDILNMFRDVLEEDKREDQEFYSVLLTNNQVTTQFGDSKFFLSSPLENCVKKDKLKIPFYDEEEDPYVYYN